MKKNDTASLIRYITAMAIFGSIGIVRRYIPMSSAALACFRGFAGCAFLLVLSAITGRLHQGGRLQRRELLLLIFSGALIGFNWMFLFEAYNYTKVATATLCYYMQPTIVILLSPLLFREKLTWKKGLCALLSLIGMVLVSGMTPNSLPTAADTKGILFGLTAALLYAIIVILNKKLPGIEPNRKTIVQLGSAAVVILPYIFLSGQSFRLELAQPGTAAMILPIVMLIVAGVVHTGIAYVMYFGSMDGLRTQTVAVLGYLDPVIAVILSAVLLGEWMNIWEILGAVLILGAALVSEL